ncbi:2OG-Fe(II) oxygenase, partial [Sphingomonas sp.]|uniref:2OG-Fe(II) oxygenase n=1 Tax=Sphingomonas sp. TaxID=28214 RepID=UPI003B3BDA97
MIDFRLHPAIDPAALRAQFAETGIVQIDPFLPDALVRGLAENLSNRRDWKWIFNNGEKVYELPRQGSDALTAEQEARLRGAIVAQARDDFQFCFESVRVPDARHARDRSDTLHAFAEFMCGATVMELIRHVTDVAAVSFADAQATLYRPGDFLTAHDDVVPGKQRHAAYVMGLTEHWRAEWGGLLLFHDEHGDVRRGFTPRANVLTLFS